MTTLSLYATVRGMAGIGHNYDRMHGWPVRLVAVLSGPAAIVVAFVAWDVFTNDAEFLRAMMRLPGDTKRMRERGEDPEIDLEDVPYVLPPVVH